MGSWHFIKFVGSFCFWFGIKYPPNAHVADKHIFLDSQLKRNHITSPERMFSPHLPCFMFVFNTYTFFLLSYTAIFFCFSVHQGFSSFLFLVCEPYSNFFLWQSFGLFSDLV